MTTPEKKYSIRIQHNQTETRPLKKRSYTDLPPLLRSDCVNVSLRQTEDRREILRYLAKSRPAG